MRKSRLRSNFEQTKNTPYFALKGELSYGLSIVSVLDKIDYIDDLVQNSSISIANALKILQFYIKPSISYM